MQASTPARNSPVVARFFRRQRVVQFVQDQRLVGKRQIDHGQPARGHGVADCLGVPVKALVVMLAAFSRARLCLFFTSTAT